MGDDRLSVVLLALPESTPAAIYGLHEFLGSVGAVWSQITGEAEVAARRFRPVIASRDGASFASPAGPLIAVEAALGALPQPDIVIVTDLAFPRTTDPRGRWPVEAAWTRERHAGGAVICSVCTGSVVLAEAGLLDGLEATTHWSAAPLFRDHYPQVRLEVARILCPAGPEHRIVTAGGASSWTDLALYLVARFAGEAEARRIAKAFVVGDRSEGQLPFAARARPRQHEDQAITRAQIWIVDNYTVPNPVGRMAEEAKLPERTFARRFRKATGYAPVDYVQALRIEEAKQMLETTAEPTDDVAAAVGYADPAFFRRLFKRQVGVSPARYRQRFQGLGSLRSPAGREGAQPR
jgi:transcriptional regulator GlxA family with amidase domain